MRYTAWWDEIANLEMRLVADRPRTWPGVVALCLLLCVRMYVRDAQTGAVLGTIEPAL